MKISLYTLWNRFVASLSTQKILHTPRLWLHQWLSEFQKCHKNYLVLRGYQTEFFFLLLFFDYIRIKKNYVLYTETVI